MSSRDPIGVVEDVLQVLSDGAFNSTYKYAVLLGLIDACVANPGREVVTTRELAEQVVALYWPQVRPHAGRVLSQNAGKQAGILRAVAAFRQEHDAPLVRARLLPTWPHLLDEVEWKLIEMPLPKLQRLGGQCVETIYRIHWTDNSLPARRDVACGRFDNRILLLPGVADALVRMVGVLRPFIQQQWAFKVARLNDLPEAELPRVLFGAQREDLTPIREGLAELQDGRCFYCDGHLGGKFEVDHFLPWSRVPSDDLANLVAADRTCNNDKRDFLPGPDHLRQWRSRELEPLQALAVEATWSFAPELAFQSARALYWPLGTSARLWTGPKQFTVADPAVVRAVLG